MCHRLTTSLQQINSNKTVPKVPWESSNIFNRGPSLFALRWRRPIDLLPWCTSAIPPAVCRLMRQHISLAWAEIKEAREIYDQPIHYLIKELLSVLEPLPDSAVWANDAWFPPSGPNLLQFPSCPRDTREKLRISLYILWYGVCCIQQMWCVDPF